MLRNSPHSFGWPARWLHWLTAAAVIAALVFIETKDWFPRGSATRAGIFYARDQTRDGIDESHGLQASHHRRGCDDEHHHFREAVAHAVEKSRHVLHAP